jgi:hypothetical protein
LRGNFALGRFLHENHVTKLGEDSSAAIKSGAVLAHGLRISAKHMLECERYLRLCETWKATMYGCAILVYPKPIISFEVQIWACGVEVATG